MNSWHTLDPVDDFVYKPIRIPKEEAYELFMKTNPTDQQFYLGTIGVEHLPEVYLYQNYTMGYFNMGINWDADSIEYIYKINNSGGPKSYITDFEFYLKLVWLGYDYCMASKGGPGFTNPIGIHWNPRSQKHVVHPGVVRYAIARLFGKDVFAYYFSTYGYVPEFIRRSMRVATIEEVMGPNSFFLVPDHGTLIPHVTYTDGMIKGSVREHNMRIREAFLYQDVKVSANIDLNHFLPVRFIAEKDAAIRINFTKSDRDTANRAMIAMNFPFQHMEFDGFTIEKTYGEGEFIYET